MKDVNYCFTTGEFALLAEKIGMNSYFGFSDSDVLNPEKKDYILAMNKLVRGGILSVSDDGLVFSDDIRDLFNQIKTSDTAMVVYSDLPVEPPVCCYLGKNVVLTEIPHTGTKIRIKVMDYFDFFDYFFDKFVKNEGVPITEDDTETGENPAFEETVNYLISHSANMKPEDIVSFDNVENVIDFIDCRTGKMKKRICVTENIVSQFAVEVSDESRKVYLFKKDYLKDCIGSIVSFEV